MSDHPENRRPVVTVQDVLSLDDAEMMQGYFDGLDNEPCGGNRSRSYWHGWRNGRVDGKHAQKDADQAVLAREYLQYLRKH